MTERYILLVDDDPLVVKVYAERMKHEGWQVAIARDGWEAAQEAQRAAFDLILLDIRMPMHGGIEVLKAIREGDKNRETPVYVLTSLSEGPEIDDALALGASGVFHKSATPPDELVREVDAILSGQFAGPESVAMFAPVQEQAGGQGLGGGQASAGTAAAVQEVRLEGLFDVYINPMLGQGSALSQALGLPELFTCPACEGQICLRLAPHSPGESREVIGLFVCSRCEKEI